MSNISEMNAAIRRNTTLGGSALAVAAAVAIAPEAATKLIAEGEPTKKLWWLLATGAFVLVALLLEGLDFARKTRHRAEVDDLIVTTIVTSVCGHAQCLQRTKPNQSVRRAAMGIFYAKIDSPSRDVAFHQWGWYYTSVLWLRLSLALFLGSFAISWFVSTDHPEIRWPALAVLLLTFPLSHGIGAIWRKKTKEHTEMQLTQIRPELGTRLPGAECPQSGCPST